MGKYRILSKNKHDWRAEGWDRKTYDTYSASSPAAAVAKAKAGFTARTGIKNFHGEELKAVSVPSQQHGMFGMPMGRRRNAFGF